MLKITLIEIYNISLLELESIYSLIFEIQTGYHSTSPNKQNNSATSLDFFIIFPNSYHSSYNIMSKLGM